MGAKGTRSSHERYRLMPLTQTRMIAVLDDARAISTTLDALRDDVRGVLGQGSTSAELKLRAISALVDAHCVPSTPALVIERNHFARCARSNSKNAEKMARRRARKRESNSAHTQMGDN